LVWLAGEAVVVVPELVPDWPQPAVAAPYYSDEDQGKPEERNWLTLPCQRQAILTTTQQKRSLLDTLMRRRHTSRCVVAARALAVWQQYQIPVPRLLAFGQRETRSRLDAFLLVDPIPGALRLEDTNLSADQRRALVKSAGRLLSDLHRLRYRIHDSTTADPAFVWTDSGLAIGSPFAWRKTRTRRRVVADLNDMVSILSITTQRELLRFLKAYDPVRAREYFKKCRNSLT
jgi:hypothetical protein